MLRCVSPALLCHLPCRWVSGEWDVEPPFLSSSRLVLHFDINKTVLMSDSVQDAGTQHMVNMLLAECAWGRLEAGPTWKPVGRLATDRWGRRGGGAGGNKLGDGQAGDGQVGAAGRGAGGNKRRVGRTGQVGATRQVCNTWHVGAVR